MALANTTAARLRLIVGRTAYQHQVEPNPAEAERYCADVPMPDRRERLVCSCCGSREVDMD